MERKYNLILLFMKYQKGKDEMLFDKIIELLKLNILKYVSKTPKKYQADVYQNLLIEVYITSQKFDFALDYLDENLFNLKNYSLIKEYSFDKKSIKSIFNNNYLNNFILNNKADFIDSFFDDKKRKEFIHNFALFNKENQLIRYINKRFNFVVLKCLDENNKYVSLDVFFEKGIELSLSSDDYEEKNNSLSSKDKQFLSNFIENDRILTQKEVAKKLNVTQQYISKKINKIKEQYHI